MSEGTTIGQSVMISGELRAEEDLTAMGRGGGKSELGQNGVTGGPDGRVTGAGRRTVWRWGKMPWGVSGRRKTTFSSR